MSAICPEGHTSESTDYCDVCGAPMTAAAPVAPAASGGASAAAAEPTTCPHCQAPAPAGALFCENCGYDFTTGTAPSSSAAWPAPGAGAASAAPAPAPSSLDLDPAPAAPGSGVVGDPGAPAALVTPVAPEGGAVVLPDPPAGGPSESSATSGASSVVDPEATPAKGLPTPALPGPDEWVAEVWIDPDWYRAQSPEDPIPSVGMPLVVPLRSRSVLVGRPSKSRGIHPDVDCGADTGVSRRQCQLTTDGQRWWVEDLDSANGTYVSPVGEALPTAPIPGGARQELEEGARIFVGGWTRVVVRRGIPGEI